MCGSLKFENMTARIGNYIPVANMVTGQKGQCIWSGFAKEEKLKFWKMQGLVYLAVCVNSFTEQSTEFCVPHDKLLGIGLLKDVHVRGKLIAPNRSMKLVTRPPASDFEKRLHNRWPIASPTFFRSQVKLEYGVQYLPDSMLRYSTVFDSDDIIKGQKEMSL